MIVSATSLLANYVQYCTAHQPQLTQESDISFLESVTKRKKVHHVLGLGVLDWTLVTCNSLA